jgi:hypothetical protein
VISKRRSGRAGFRKNRNNRQHPPIKMEKQETEKAQNKRKRPPQTPPPKTPITRPSDISYTPSPSPAPYQLSPLLTKTGEDSPTSLLSPHSTRTESKRRRTELNLTSPIPTQPHIQVDPEITTELHQVSPLAPWGDDPPYGPPLTGEQHETVPQNPTNLVEINPQKNAEIMARFAAMTGRDLASSQTTHTALQNKYIDARMPPIHDEHPLGPLEAIAPDQLQAWLEIPTGKLLARPFDIDVHFQPHHNRIAKELMAAVKDITGAANVSVAAPIKNRNGVAKARHPIAFLIHDLSANDVSHLESRSVWATRDFAFQISPIPPGRPCLLFTIEGLTTNSRERVHNLVIDTWKDPTSIAFLSELLSQTPEEKQQETRNEITAFVDSVQVQCLSCGVKGGGVDPYFNIYAAGDTIKEAETWIDIRNFFRGRTYKSPLLGKGTAKGSTFYCTLCHGKDHPRGMCPFLAVKGWEVGLQNRKRGRPPYSRRVEESADRDRRWR